MAEEEVASILIRVNKAQEIVGLFVETTNPLVEEYVKNRLNYKKVRTLQKGKYITLIHFISKKIFFKNPASSPGFFYF